MYMLKIIKCGVFDSSLIFKNIEQTPERITQYYEIELYISGNGESFIDGIPYTHEKGNLLFIRPNQKRYSRKSFVCFHVHLEMDHATAALLQHVPVVSKVIRYSRYKTCYTEIIEIAENRDNTKTLLLQSKVYELLNMIAEDAVVYRNMQTADSSIDPRIIQKAISFIEEHYKESISLQDIADSINMSPSHLHKIFKISTQKTPHAFLAEKRLTIAKTLLLTKDWPLELVAEEAGFSSLAYFDYCFKTAYNITPKQFRAQKYTL